MRAPRLLSCLALFALSPAMAAQEPNIYDAAKAAVASEEIEPTGLAGTGRDKNDFRDVPKDGSILIGFDIALNKQFDDEIIRAIRPVYRNEISERTGTNYGRFSVSGRTKNEPANKSISLRAKPGFAVGQITLRCNYYVQGFSITYMKVNGARLDPTQKYTSSWYGNRGGDEIILGGEGRPIVGIFGNADENRVKGLGLIRFTDAELVPKPIEPVKEPEKPAAEEEKAAAPAVAPEEPKQGTPWLNVAISAGVGGLVIIVLLVVFGRKKKPEAERPPRRGPAERRPRSEPAPTAGGRQSEPARVEDEVMEVLPVESDEAVSTAVQTNRPVPVPQVYAKPQSSLSSLRLGQRAPKFLPGRVSFTWRGQRFYRLYMFPDELLLVDAGPVTSKKANGTGFILFGLWGYLIRSAIAEGERVEADNRQKRLDRADTEELLSLADEGKNCFRAGPSDLLGATLEVPSFWKKMFGCGFDCHGILRLRHETRGEFVVELLGQHVIRAATEKLPSILGNRLEVRATWDKKEGRFV